MAGKSEPRFPNPCSFHLWLQRNGNKPTCQSHGQIRDRRSGAHKQRHSFWENRKGMEGGSLKAVPSVENGDLLLLQGLTWAAPSLPGDQLQKQHCKTRWCHQQDWPRAKATWPVFFQPFIKEISKQRIKSTLLFTNHFPLHLLPIPHKTLYPSNQLLVLCFAFMLNTQRMFR